MSDSDFSDGYTEERQETSPVREKTEQALPEKGEPDYQYFPAKKAFETQLSFRLLPTTSLGAGPDSFEMKYSWNERFQAMLEKPTSTPEEGLHRHNEIHLLSKELAENAKPYVKQIIEELKFPHKKYPPLETVGGIAGGLKYIIDHMFFKFATDDGCKNMYGSDENAAKAAGHELKAMNVLISTSIRKLHVPLSCIINYRGYRLLVNALLPVNGKSLISGSRDGARTIKTDPEAQHYLKQVGEHLNLKTHRVKATATEQEHYIHTAVDIECHRGIDGRHYVLDLARLLPPEAPVPKIDRYFLYRLLRAEYVKRYPFALSADAFATFGQIDHEQNDAEITRATDKLFAEEFYALAGRILDKYNDMENQNKYVYEEGRIKRLFHDCGVNMRFSGVILQIIADPNHKKQAEPSAVSPSTPAAPATVYGNIGKSDHSPAGNVPAPSPLEKHKAFPDSKYRTKAVGDIATEIGARIFKSIINLTMRKKGGSDVFVKSMVAENICSLVGDGDDSKDFWEKPVAESLRQKFIFCMGRVPKWQTELEAFLFNGKLESLIKAQHENLLIRIQSLTGIIFEKETIENIAKDPKILRQELPITLQDIREISTTEKYLQVFPFVEVLAQEGHFEEAEQYYKTELESWRRTLGDSHPQVAKLLTHMAHLYTNYTGKTRLAEGCFKEAIEILSKSDKDPIEVAYIQEQLACYYNNAGFFSDAEILLQEVLKVKTDKLGESAQTAVTHDNLAWAYHNLRRMDKAQIHYENAIQIHEKQGTAKSPESIARILNNKALLLNAVGQKDEAIQETTKSLKILEETRSPWHSEVAIARENLGKFYSSKQDYVTAEKEFKFALEIKKKTQGPTHFTVALTLRRLASLYYKKGDKQLAIETLREALAILGDSHPESAATKQSLDFLLDQVNGVDTSSRLQLQTQISCQKLDGHISLGGSGIQISRVSPLWREILRKANISRRDLKDPNLTQAILELIEQTMRTGRNRKLEKIPTPKSPLVTLNSEAPPPSMSYSKALRERVQNFARSTFQQLLVNIRRKSTKTSHITAPASTIETIDHRSSSFINYTGINDGFVDEELDGLLKNIGLRLSVSLEDELILPDIEQLGDSGREKLAQMLAQSMKKLRVGNFPFSEPVDDWDEPDHPGGVGLETFLLL